MKLKKEVEMLTSICNDMNSKEETVRNENKMVEKEKSLDIRKGEKISSKHKDPEKKLNKEKKGKCRTF